jgi:hypothetical protein
MALACTLLLLPSLAYTVSCLRVLGRQDTRVEAAKWIQEHVPEGTVLLVDSLFGLPLLQDRKMLQDKVSLIEEQQAWRWRLKKRYELLLARPGYPPAPGYYTYYFQGSEEGVESEEGELTLKSVRWDDTTDIFLRVEGAEELKRRGVRFIVTEEHSLSMYSRVSPELETILEESFEPIRVFSPLEEAVAENPKPIFDPIDAFYVPLARFEGIRRPGPTIRIYGWKDNLAESH